MALVLFNPTDKLGKEFQEDFRTHYMGKGLIVKAGKKVKFPDATAKHILTEFSPRGLVVLEYGDEEKIDQIAQEGLDKNREFKLRQLNNFNETNEARKHTGLPYHWPKPFLKLYAKELGLQLTESYKVDDTHLRMEKELREENAGLRQQMKELMAMVTDKLSLTKSETKPADPDIPVTKNGSPDKRYKIPDEKEPGG